MLSQNIQAPTPLQSTTVWVTEASRVLAQQPINSKPFIEEADQGFAECVRDGAISAIGEGVADTAAEALGTRRLTPTKHFLGTSLMHLWICRKSVWEKIRSWIFLRITMDFFMQEILVSIQ